MDYELTRVELSGMSRKRSTKRSPRTASVAVIDGVEDGRARQAGNAHLRLSLLSADANSRGLAFLLSRSLIDVRLQFHTSLSAVSISPMGRI